MEVLGSGEELREVLQGEIPVAVPERVERDHYERERHEQQHEYRVRERPAASFYCHDFLVSFMFPETILIPTRSPLSQTSVVSTKILSPSSVLIVRW